MRSIFPQRKTRPFPFSNITNSKQFQTWVWKCTNTIERGRLYHKTIVVIFGSGLLQIGDDQGPHTNDSGHNVHKMRHNQIICQNGFSQRGWDDIKSRISALFSQYTKNWVIASPSKLPNTLEVVRCKQGLNRRRSKLGSSISFWQYPLPRYSQKASTRMVDSPVQLLIHPVLKLLDNDRYCNKPTLPHKFSERYIYPRCEERPACISSHCSLNSTLQLPHDLAQLMQSNKIREHIPLRMME